MEKVTEQNTSRQGVTRKYNLFILLPNLLEEEVEAINKEIVESINKVGGELVEANKMGKRKLSYVVKKIRHGNYINYTLNLATDKNDALIKELKLRPEILRFELSNFQDGIKTLNQEAVDEKGQIKMNTRKIEESEKNLSRQGVTSKKNKVKKDKQEKVEDTDKSQMSTDDADNKKEDPAEDGTRKKDKKKISTEALNEKLDDILSEEVEV